MTSLGCARRDILHQLGVRIDTPENRRIAHYKVYLFQCFCWSIGFSFVWRDDGPFSPYLDEYLETAPSPATHYEGESRQLNSKVVKAIDDIRLSYVIWLRLFHRWTSETMYEHYKEKASNTWKCAERTLIGPKHWGDIREE